MNPTTRRFRSWRLLLAGAAVLAVALGGWLSSQATEPPSGIAAWLMIENPILWLDKEQIGQNVRPEASIQTHAVLIVSPDVLAAALAELRTSDPKLVAGQTDPLAWLRKGIRVNPLAETIFSISMPNEPREHQATIINAVTEAYLAAARAWESRREKMLVESSTKALTRYQLGLLQSREKLRKTGPDEPERAAALRDEIAVLEDVTRRIAKTVEMANLEALSEDSLRLIARARP